MAEFEYDKPVAPIEKQSYSLEQLFSNLTPVVNEPTNFRGSIYGEPGLGKTYAGIELAQRITPADKAIVYVFTGTNWDSVKDVPWMCQRLLKKPYQSMDELVAFVEAFKNPSVRAQFPVGTVVFDEYNTMFDDDVDTITAINSALLMKEKKKYKDPHTPEWPDYNMAKMHMKDIMNTVLNVPDINFIFLCHERDGKQSYKKEPDFFAKAAQEFMRPLSCLYRLTTQIQDGEVVRILQTQGTDQVTAKNRITGVPAFVGGNTAIEQVAEAYKSWSKAETDKQQSPVETPVPETEQKTAEETPETVSSPVTESVESPQVTNEPAPASSAEPAKAETAQAEQDLRSILGI